MFGLWPSLLLPFFFVCLFAYQCSFFPLVHMPILSLSCLLIFLVFFFLLRLLCLTDAIKVLSLVNAVKLVMISLLTVVDTKSLVAEFCLLWPGLVPLGSEEPTVLQDVCWSLGMLHLPRSVNSGRKTCKWISFNETEIFKSYQ